MKLQSITTNPTQLTRADMATVAAVYRTENRKLEILQGIGLGGGLASGFALMLASEALKWGTSLDPFFFLTGWALGLTGFYLGWRKRRKLRAELQLHCASCGGPLLAGGKMQDALARADTIIATGTCTSCGSSFLTGEEDR